MKKSHLIFLSTLIFVALFYDTDSIGLNFSILTLFLSIWTWVKTKPRNKTRTFKWLMAMSVASSVAYAWYGDFVSFLAVVSSLSLLRIKMENRYLKALLTIPIVVINAFTFVCQFFNFEAWIGRPKTLSIQKSKLIMWLFPLFFGLLFFIIYSWGSHHFAEIWQYEWAFDWDIKFDQLLILLVLGFYLMFCFWQCTVQRFILKRNHKLSDDFTPQFAQQTPKPTYSILDINSERQSGVLTFITLNILLVVFIITFNYEQFFETKTKAYELSSDLHSRVNVIILCIIMAILVILFYFKSFFNFDPKAKTLKLSAKIWILLNAVLVASAMVKNTEYIYHFGLTYLRLGVYAFLILSLIGLAYTFRKITHRKTNMYLFNQVFWYFYGTILACSFINWGGIIEAYNRHHNKGLDYIDRINYCEKQIINHPDYYSKYFIEDAQDTIECKQTSDFRSKTLYYDTYHFTTQP